MDADYIIAATFNPDGDIDNCSDEVENGGPNGGDGDDNGTPDAQESNVATFLNIDRDYCTMVSPDDTELEDVTAQNNPSAEDAPANVEFTAGFFQFSLKGITAGGCSEVTLLLPKDTRINTYYKYGPTPDNPASHWYEFLFNGETGAEIFQEEYRTRIVLHLCDGKRGDNDLDDSNAVIDDIGGPAKTVSGMPSATTGSATSVTSSSATLNGTVNPNGASTSYYFDYGTTTNYGSKTAKTDAGLGTEEVSVGADLTELSEGTTYHFRLVATDRSRTSYGNDAAFATKSDGGGDGGGDSCFIATVVYGSQMEPDIKEVRDFGDRPLITNSAGKAF